MSSGTSLSPELALHFTAPGAVAWCALALGVSIAIARGWHAAGRGRALQRWTGAVAGAYALEAVLLMALSLHPDSDPIDFTSVVVEDAAEAGFISLLLAIAGGFSITRPGLGPHRAKVVAVPVLYFGTALVVDLTEEWAAIKGVDPVTDAGTPGALSPSAALLFSVCQVVALVALLLAWVMIFDVVARERAALAGTGEGIVGAAAAPAGAPSSAPGHAVALPPDVEAAARERGSDLTDVYAVVSADAGADEAKSAADVVERNAKRRLLAGFVTAVTLYVCVRAAAIVVPLVVLPSPDATDGVVTAIILLEDAARLAFLGGLAWLFRPRPDSPYLLVGGGDGEVTTELGVLSARVGAAPLFAGPRSDAAPAAAAAAAAAPGVDGRFALGDSDSDYGEGKPAGGKGARRASGMHDVSL